jgi:hypothetical protein
MFKIKNVHIFQLKRTRKKKKCKDLGRKRKTLKNKIHKNQQKTAESAKKNEKTQKPMKTREKRVVSVLNGSRPKSSPARVSIKGARVGRDVGFLVYVHVLGFFLFES